MSPNRKASKKSREQASAQKAEAQSPVPLSPARLRWFRFVAVFVLPLAFLGVLEAALRIGGYGYDTAFFQKVRIRGEARLADNPRFSLRFFPPHLARITVPVVTKAEKPAGATRIFIFGESAALGDPRPEFGAGRYMEALLRMKHPDRNFEVVNTSMTAINSHVIREIAEDCSDKNGDIWLVYMGNNEMVGPFGAATVFGPKGAPLWLVRLKTELQEWRVGQLIADFSRHTRRSEEAKEWLGMEMFLENLVPPGDPRREVVYRNYRKNLEAIVQHGRRARARLILSTVAVNTTDCPPFAPFATNSLSAQERTSLAEALARSDAAIKSGNWPGASNSYATALAKLPNIAGLHYGMGEALLRLQNSTGARAHFEKARDLDALPFRTDSRINTLIREVVGSLPEGEALLCDAEAALAGAAGSGAESFFEHVHFNFDGNYRLGRAWAEAVERMLPVSENRDKAWPTQQQCELAIGLTDWNRISVVLEVLERCRLAPLSTQSNNGSRTHSLESWVAQLKSSASALPEGEVRRIYEEAIRSRSDDYALHQNYAEYLEETGKIAEALARRQEVRDLTPHYYFSHLIVGRLLKRQKQYPAALDSLQTALRLKPDQPQVLSEIGSVLALQNRWVEALEHFDNALKFAPGSPRLLQFRADALWKLERRAEAIESLRGSLSARPEHTETRYRLGEFLALSGDLPGAAKEFAEVLRIRPENTKARVNLGVALANLGRTAEALTHFEEILKTEPQNRLALQYRETAQRQLGGR